MEKVQMLAVIPENLAGSFLKHLQPKHTEIMVVTFDCVCMVVSLSVHIRPPEDSAV